MSQPEAETKKQYRWRRPVAGVVAVGAVIGIGLAVDNRTAGQVGIKTTAEQSVASATVSAPIPLQEGCFLKYDSNVVKSEVGFRKTVNVGGLSLPTGISHKESFSGAIGNKVCNEKDNAYSTLTYNKTTGKGSMVVNARDLTVEVYRLDMNDSDVFASRSGLGLIAFTAVAEVLKSNPTVAEGVSELPNGQQFLESSDGMQTSMRNWAELSAYEVSAKSCGRTVWNEGSATYADDLASYTAKIGSAFVGKTISPADINVTFSGRPTFATQYEGQADRIKTQLSQAGISVTTQNPKDVICTPEK